ncbi:type II toxin-antitoxin system HicB family antitoxin [Campylobacter ureolyticus]|uniref:type II toxin-antitoxin system HicB family antitoxin n=1 Tax=Campylobacter ureolyticus TaxID=827 RepID=UPI0022B53516|nr:type II toxin-antitoxin system HicB family antitoxin [Campylobacter ureolyticus]MCZ6111667.1 type II toxin-antitoxin system HicB family antitoxin [Campylobacter ureolyticus]
MKNLEYYLNLPYKIELKKIPLDEGGGWAAFMPELNSVSFFYGDGDTKEKSLKELDEAFKFTIESALKDGIKIPEPVDEDAKVRINLTIPKSVLSAIDAVTNNRSKWISDLSRKTLLM